VVSWETIEELQAENLRLQAENDRLTRECAALRRAAHDATHDDLTGLGNNRWLRQYWNHVQASDASIEAVMMIDGDGIKSINDRYGHEVGDRAITHIADALRATQCPAIRRGGDEFLLIVPSGRDPLSVASEISGTVSTPLSVPDGRATVTVSIGVAECGNGHEVLSDLISVADSAMYQAKRSGPGKVITESNFSG